MGAKEQLVVSGQRPAVDLPCLQTGTRTIATHGLVVCFLPQAMVVLQNDVESFQMSQFSVQRVGLVASGRRNHRGARSGKRHPGGLFGGRGNLGQGLE